jgi:hypothetical protein
VLDLLHREVEFVRMRERPTRELAAVVRQHPLQRDPRQRPLRRALITPIGVLLHLTHHQQNVQMPMNDVHSCPGEPRGEPLDFGEAAAAAELLERCVRTGEALAAFALRVGGRPSRN